MYIYIMCGHHKGLLLPYYSNNNYKKKKLNYDFNTSHFY